MISCLEPDQMMLFASMLGDIVTFLENNARILINANAGPVVWEIQDNGLYCIVSGGPVSDA